MQERKFILVYNKQNKSDQISWNRSWKFYISLNYASIWFVMSLVILLIHGRDMCTVFPDSVHWAVCDVAIWQLRKYAALIGFTGYGNPTAFRIKNLLSSHLNHRQFRLINPTAGGSTNQKTVQSIILLCTCWIQAWRQNLAIVQYVCQINLSSLNCESPVDF